METKGYYSILRFVPDPFRDEGVNLGVILLCPEHGYVDWRITTNHQRARRFFKYEADPGRLRLLGRDLNQRLERERVSLLSVDYLTTFARRHRDVLQLTEPRTCAVDDPVHDLTTLYSHIVEVEDSSKPRSALNSQQVRAHVSSRLDADGLLRFMQPDIQLSANYKTRPYSFSFAYQNGAPLSIIEATSFAYKDPEVGCERALILLGEIDDVSTHTDVRAESFSVVGAFHPDQPEVEKAVDLAFRERRVRLYRVEHLDPLVERVKSELLHNGAS